MTRETPAERDGRLRATHIAQAEAAVADLATVEQQARDRVAAAELRLKDAEAELKRVIEEEAPATRERLKKMRAAGGGLLKALREGRI